MQVLVKSSIFKMANNSKTPTDDRPMIIEMEAPTFTPNKLVSAAARSQLVTGALEPSDQLPVICIPFYRTYVAAFRTRMMLILRMLSWPTRCIIRLLR